MRWRTLAVTLAGCVACGGPGDPAETGDDDGDARDDGGGGDQDGGDGAMEGVTVTTVSIDGSAPMSGIRVQVNDLPEQLTDAEGQAVFPDATRPYSVRVVEPTGAGGNLNAWQLVARTDSHLVFPVLGSPLRGEPGGPYMGAILGRVTGIAGGPGSQVQVVHRGALYGDQRADASAAGEYGFDSLYWSVEPTRTYLLHALETDRSVEPGHYVASGATSVTLEGLESGDFAVARDVDIELAPVAEWRVRGAMVAPDGDYGDPIPEVWLEFEDHSVLPLRTYEWTDTGELEAVFPLIEGTVGRVGVAASRLDGAYTLVQQTFSAPTDEAELVLIEAVELLEPDDGASFAPDTTFRWTAAPDAERYAVQMRCEGSGVAIEYRMLETKETELRFPSIEGIDLGADTSCQWRVVHLQGAAYEYDTWTLPPAFGQARTAERFLVPAD